LLLLIRTIWGVTTIWLNFNKILFDRILISMCWTLNAFFLELWYCIVLGFCFVDQLYVTEASFHCKCKVKSQKWHISAFLQSGNPQVYDPATLIKTFCLHQVTYPYSIPTQKAYTIILYDLAPPQIMIRQPPKFFFV